MNAARRKWTIAAAAAVVIAATVGILATRAHPSRNAAPEEGADVPAAALLGRQRPSPAAAAPSKDVDLLDLVRLPADAVAGEWGFQDRALIVPPERFGRIQFACVPPEEYDLKISATRKRGYNSLNIGLVFGGRQTMLCLDGNDGASSWLFTHFEDHSLNTATHTGRLMKYNQAVRIVCSVRKSGITVSVDEKKIIDWKGLPGETYLLSTYAVPDPRTLILGSWESMFRIDEAVLTPVTGTPTLLR